MRTSNPALTAKTFSMPRTRSQAMTIEGTVNKRFILIALVNAAAFFSWRSAYPEGWSTSSSHKPPLGISQR